MTRLVLLHGRDNQGLDPDELERTWRTVLSAGLAAAGAPHQVTDAEASFVYYGDTLAALTRGDGAGAPPVTVHALPRPGEIVLDHRRIPDLPDDELEFLGACAAEILAGAGIDAPVRAEGLDLGGWVNALLSALDLIPGLSAGVITLVVRDVWAYLNDDAVRATIDDAVAAAMPTDEPAVVVGHSLGSVVAYSVLREHADAARWDVPLLLTLGSPLAIRGIRDVLAARAPLRVPAPVGRWVAARDTRDPLALHGLGAAAFPVVAGEIEDLVVENAAPGHHAAAVLLGSGTPAGYLAVPEVARPLAEVEAWSPR